MNQKQGRRGGKFQKQARPDLMSYTPTPDRQIQYNADRECVVADLDKCITRLASTVKVCYFPVGD